MFFSTQRAKTTAKELNSSNTLTPEHSELGPNCSYPQISTTSPSPATQDQLQMRSCIYLLFKYHVRAPTGPPRKSRTTCRCWFSPPTVGVQGQPSGLAVASVLTITPGSGMQSPALHPNLFSQRLNVLHAASSSKLLDVIKREANDIITHVEYSSFLFWSSCTKHAFYVYQYKFFLYGLAI